jgi:hypothetical protein
MMLCMEWNAYAHVSCNASAYASLIPGVLHFAWGRGRLFWFFDGEEGLGEDRLGGDGDGDAAVPWNASSGSSSIAL